MKLGTKGATFIKGYETGGVRPTKTSRMKLLPHGEPALEAYYDDVGVLTIGWGHTKGVKAGDRITRAQAEQFFLDDTKEAVDDVNSKLGKNATFQNQFDALVALRFNIGPGNFDGSTVLRKHLAGDYSGAAKAFALFNKGRVNGVLTVLNGLTSRRAGEAAIYLGKA